MKNLCKCGHLKNQPRGDKMTCDYARYSCNCKGYMVKQTKKEGYDNMTYGQTDIIQSMREGIQNSREHLKKAYRYLKENTSISIEKAKQELKVVDKILVNGLDSFDPDKDCIGVDGEKTRPDWINDDDD